MKKKNNNTIYSIIFGSFFSTLIIISVFSVFSVFAAKPGSEEDPVVSKSYVDTRINEILNSIQNGEPIVIDNTNNTNNVINNTDNSAVSSESLKYVPVHVGVSQTIVGGEGTEMLLRVGRGFAYIPGNEGIVDATSGQNLNNNAEIKSNHIIIFPRSDGRGIRIVEDAWFLVKGDYTIS